MKNSISTIAFVSASALALSLSSCTNAKNEDGNDIEKDVELEIDLSGGDDSSSGSSSSSSTSSSAGNGKLSLKSDGINIDIDIPKAALEKGRNSDDLYPGSKITGVNVTSNSADLKNSGVVNIKFTAPDSPEKVAEWFAKKFEDEGGSASRDGTNVSGQTGDEQDYDLSVNANGNGSNGVLVIKGDKGY